VYHNAAIQAVAHHVLAHTRVARVRNLCRTDTKRECPALWQRKCHGRMPVAVSCVSN
jgi:hypothetical protein